MRFLPIITSLVVIDICIVDSYDPDGWKAAADFLLEAMDMRADPCKNFYKYACGNWEKNTKSQFAGVPQQATKIAIERLIKVIKLIREEDPKTPEYQKSLKTFFQQCITAPTDYNQILTNVYNEAVQLIGYPMPLMKPRKKFKVNPYNLMGKMRRFLNTRVIIDAEVRFVWDKCGRVPMLTLGPAFAQGKPSPKEIEPGFEKRLVAVGAQVGIALDEQAVADRIERIKEFEQKLLNYEVEFPVTSFESAVVPKMELEKKVNPNVDWDLLFSGLMEGDMLQKWNAKNPKVFFEKPVQFFQKLDKYISDIDIKDLLDYAYIRMFTTSMEHYTITPQLLQKNVTNMTSEQKCLEYVLQHAGAAAARVYIENIGSKRDSRILEWKQDVELLCEAVFAAFRYMIHTAEWLPARDKSTIISKLNAIPLFSGIPDWILDDNAVIRNTPPSDRQFSIVHNVMYMYRRKFEWSLEPLFKETKQLLVEVDATYDEMIKITEPEPSFDWSAAFDRQASKIDVSLGLLLPPMYNYSYPLALKFGLIGWIIGHEMLHGFDSKNVNVPVGSRQLSKATLEEFEKRSNCINKQYSGYCYKKERYCVSGSTTLDDNIADMEGLKMAYMAYKFSTQMGGVYEQLPGLENVTQDQLFFLSAARIWCGTSREAMIYKSGPKDEHAPGRARIELSMMNFPAFAQSFNCPAGSKFAPLHSCDLWGDFLEPNIKRRMNRTGQALDAD